MALVVAIIFGIASTLYLRRRAARADAQLGDDDPTTNPTPAGEIAAITVHAATDPPAAAVATIRTARARGKTRRRSWRQNRR